MTYLYVIIYGLLPIALIVTAYLAFKYHYEFTKLQESVNISKDLLSKMVADKQSEDRLDGVVKDATLFMDKTKNEYDKKIKLLEKEIILYRNLFENIKIAFAIITDVTGRFSQCNKEFERISGYSEKYLQDRDFLLFLDDYKVRGNGFSNISDLIKKREFIIENKSDRTIFSVKIIYTSYEYKSENLVVVILENVTENFEIRNELNSYNRKLSIIDKIVKEVNQSLHLEEIFNHTLDKIIELTDTEAGIIMLIDTEGKRLMPVAFSGVCQELVEEIKNKHIKTNTGTRGKALLLGKPVKAGEEENSSSLTGALLKKGSLKSIVTVPLTSKNETMGIMQIGSSREERFSQEDLNILGLIGNHIGIAVSNINLYDMINKQLKQLENKNLKLTELEQMKTNLVQMIVHDLKNPLMGIMGYADLLLEDEAEYNQPQLNALKMIYISSKDLMRMILNLLDISRMEEQRVTLRLDELSLKDIITRNIADVEPILLREDKTVVFDFPEKVPIIKVDKDLIYRVIANLLNNAIKYSPPHGIITAGICYGESPLWLTVYIADQGQGIPKDYQEKIFEKFIQLEARNKNLDNIRTSRGLGLTFCKLAVEAHGGRIWVESDIGRGSKFCFNLPFICFPDEDE